jgi:hypothetical protein
VVSAVAVSAEFGTASESVRIHIPQRGEEHPAIDPAQPARWNKPTKRDDTAGVWDLIARLHQATAITSLNIGLIAESADGFQTVDFSGALEGGYQAATLKETASRMQDIVGTGAKLRLTIGVLSFPTGQALLDWLRALNQPFDSAFVSQ